MTTAWTPRAIIESYPESVHADKLSTIGYAVALLLTAVATLLLFEAFAVIVELIGSIFVMWRALQGLHSIHTSVGATGYLLGVAVRMPVLVIPFSITLGISILLYRVAGQLYLKRSGARALASPEPPIIFLRSFLSDVRPIAPSNFRSFILRRRWWPEEVFAESARDCGHPVLAIASPQARLPSMGAAKIYVADTHWQRVVEELCSRATLVVLRVGTTAGIRWELEMLGGKLREGIRLALLFCGQRGEPLSIIQYQSYLATLPDGLRSQMPAPDEAALRVAHTRAASETTAQPFIRYAVLRPDAASLIGVAYDDAALTVGSPGFSPYHVEEFRDATRQLIASTVATEVVDRKSGGRDGPVHIPSKQVFLALGLYFIISLWLAWYVSDCEAFAPFITGTEAALVLLVPALVAMTVVARQFRQWPYYVAILISAIGFIALNQHNIFLAHDARQFESELASGDVEVMNHSRTHIAQALAEATRAREDQLVQLFGQLDEARLVEALTAATLGDADKRHKLKLLAAEKEKLAAAAGTHIDEIAQHAQGQISTIYSVLPPSKRSAAIRAYETDSERGVTLLKGYAAAYGSLYEHLGRLYAIVDEQEGDFTIGRNGNLIFNKKGVVNSLDTELSVIQQSSRNIERIRRQLQGDPVK